MSSKNIVVLGAGAWGTALAQLLASNGHEVTLWAHNEPTVEAINSGHENTIRLPGVALSKNIQATTSFGALGDAEAIVLAIPAQHVRQLLQKISSQIAAGTPIIICAKGIERETLALMSEVVAAEVPQAMIAVLSGPSFAADVVRDLPTAVALAAPTIDEAKTIAALFGRPSFRPYASDDVIGTEIGGAVKNVLAIACGIVAGRELGASANAALIARGFAEMTRFGLAMGGQSETLAGLSGLGDLVLTCTSTQSRNYSLGVDIGRGLSIEQAIEARGAISEGAFSAAAVSARARKLNVDMPIVFAVEKIVGGELDIATAIKELLSRPFRAEGI